MAASSPPRPPSSPASYATASSTPVPRPRAPRRNGPARKNRSAPAGLVRQKRKWCQVRLNMSSLTPLSVWRPHEHAVPGRAGAAGIRRVPVPVPDSRAVGLQRRVHAGRPDGQAGAVRGPREGVRGAHGPAPGYQPPALLPVRPRDGGVLPRDERHLRPPLRLLAPPAPQSRPPPPP